MFDSFYEHPDLMFLDATVQLTRLTMSLDDYLGPDMIQLLLRTDPRMCNSVKNHFLSFLIIPLLILFYIL